MAPPVDYRDPAGPTASRGPAFLYVAPCTYEDLLKLGFSRDPLARLQSMHPRYYEVFDLDRTMLVGTETVRDARAIELKLRRALVEHNAPPPLVMRAEAGGGTEWYRGAYGALGAEAKRLEEQGHAVQRGARGWMRTALLARSDRLYSWVAAMLPSDGFAIGSIDPRLQRTVIDALGAYGAVGIDVEPLLPPHLHEWWNRHRAV